MINVTLVPFPPAVLVSFVPSCVLSIPSLMPCPAAEGTAIVFAQVIKIIFNFLDHSYTPVPFLCRRLYSVNH